MSEVEKIGDLVREMSADEWSADPDVQAVYALLCDAPSPPGARHWEGWLAERVAVHFRAKAARRVEELEGALKVFAAIVPSSLHPADGSEAEAYVIMLHDPKMLGQGGAPDFTGADLARARSALSEGSGSSRELAHPDESGDACGATERAEG